MKSLPFLLVALSWTVILATDDAPHAAFFDSMENHYKQEIVECGDNVAYMSKASIVAWKEHMTEVAQTPEYLALLKEYRKIVGSSTTVLPCKVIAWNEQRRQLQAKKEEVLTKELLLHEDYENALRERDSLPKSVYDPLGIPFGISKRSFILLFKEKCPKPFVDMGYHIYITDMTWGDYNYLTAFYFDRKTDRLIRYEIESNAVVADNLNKTTRVDGENITRCLIRDFGPPSKTFRIGFFDIKSNTLTPLSMWDADGFSVYVGLSMSKYRYYAKAVICKTNDQSTP